MTAIRSTVAGSGTGLIEMFRNPDVSMIPVGGKLESARIVGRRKSVSETVVMSCQKRRFSIDHKIAGGWLSSPISAVEVGEERATPDGEVADGDEVVNEGLVTGSMAVVDDGIDLHDEVFGRGNIR